MTRGTGPREHAEGSSSTVPGLLDIADTLAAATTDYRALLEVAAQAVAASLGDAAVLWVLEDEHYLRPVAFHHDNPLARAFMRDTVDGHRHLPESGGLLEQARRSESPGLFPTGSLYELRERVDTPYPPYYPEFGLSNPPMIPLLGEDRAGGR